MHESAKKIERNHGIDLLRIVAMFMIVVLHVVGHGGILDATLGLTLKGEVAWFLEIACYCSVNCYALISGFVAINSKRKWRTFISLWFQVVFYCVVINAMDIILSGGFDAIGLIGVLKVGIHSFLPSLTNRYWYFTAYTGVFLCMPILNWIVNHIPRSLLKASFIGSIFIFYCGDRLLSSGSALALENGCSFLWLALLYVMGAYMAKYDSLKRLSFKKSILGFVLCVVITFLTRIGIEIVICLIKGYVVKNSYEALMLSYTTPTIVLAAVFLLNAFRQMQFSEMGAKVIGLFAPLSFGVYLLHTHPVVFWKLHYVFSDLARYHVVLMVLCIIGSAVGIYILCTVVELLRKMLFSLLRINKAAICIEKNAEKLFQKVSPVLGINPADFSEENMSLDDLLHKDVNV